MSEHVLISCATGSRESADAIATALVEQRLAACVQIVAVESIFRWAGALSREPELLLQIKTAAHRAADVEACIKQLHTYELPEIAIVELRGSREYLAWIDASVARVAPAGTLDP